MKTATRDAPELQTSNAGSNVNRVKKAATRLPKNKKYTHKSRSRSTCVHCGRTNYHSADCRYKNPSCHKCNA
ncbi:hypothetical protein DPMN_073082 [Dreissena polymorpha]|uniref:Uncharacterized protein n=1 Tax=Dreissena polymorpha TaxID=45954 RepID=A0A9D4HAF0_DREPO|nr:hypothetical protein DPMN_073082 [Dreissena polymorpha]